MNVFSDRELKIIHYLTHWMLSKNMIEDWEFSTRVGYEKSEVAARTGSDNEEVNESFLADLNNKDDLIIANNIINEVAHGLRIDQKYWMGFDFDRKDLDMLLDKIEYYYHLKVT